MQKIVSFLPLSFLLCVLSCKNMDRTSGQKRIEKDSAGLYTYSFCIHLLTVPAQLIANQTLGTAPGDSAWVDMEMKGSRGQPIVQGLVTTLNIGTGEKKESLTDDHGRLSVTLVSGTYKIAFQSVGTISYSLDSLTLQRSQKQKIVVSLGEPSCFRTVEIKSTKRITEKELEKRRLNYDGP
jgi:hypothetical protein